MSPHNLCQCGKDTCTTDEDDDDDGKIVKQRNELK